MRRKLSIAYFAHSLRSDWNNGNAHFLRGLLREMSSLGHQVRAFEPETGWSYTNLLSEEEGARSLDLFKQRYPELDVVAYPEDTMGDVNHWRLTLRDTQVVVLHEWNSPALSHVLLGLRKELKFRLIFHDTHHRASSSPKEIERFGIDRFDGVLTFGEALRTIYRDSFDIQRAWTLHEGADTKVFRPHPETEKLTDVLWIGNWGEDERSGEIRKFLLDPAKGLPQRRFLIYGVRYPEEGLKALRDSGISYGGYLPNLSAPCEYSRANLTVHIPRQVYSNAMTGIPTIRMFEALACGIPLISAPWKDTEALFRADDFTMVFTAEEMTKAIQRLLGDPKAASSQANSGLETVLARHTCMHRAQQLTEICEEVLQ